MIFFATIKSFTTFRTFALDLLEAFGQLHFQDFAFSELKELNVLIKDCAFFNFSDCSSSDIVEASLLNSSAIANRSESLGVELLP